MRSSVPVQLRQADPGLLAIANTYLARVGLPAHKAQAPDYPVDEELAARIADTYEALRHAPRDPAVVRSYQALKSDTLSQFLHLARSGLRFEPWVRAGQPYVNSAEMTADARAGHLYFFLGGDFPDDHLLVEDSGVTAGGHPLTFNDLFRCAHDCFGHALFLNGFGPRGEEMAWRTHAAMFSEPALPAMSSETRGQNNWFNYGGHIRRRWLAPKDRPYAEQKCALLPEDLLRDAPR